MGDAAAIILPDGTFYELGGELLVGRAPGNDLVLSKPGVSRRHARLTSYGGRWFVEDQASLYGTFVNAVRLQPGVLHPLRHGDRIEIGEDTFVFAAGDQLTDPDETRGFEAAVLASARPLSPFQRDVVAALCEPWLKGGNLAELPSNEEIAAQLGTPGAVESIKAALRRAYAKAGLAGEPAATKRRSLCIVARRRGWI